MITKLSLTNFKSWREIRDMRLAPITGLFGSNSSGKTSILQLLLMLKQTTESADRFQPLDLGDQRSTVDLGTFTDLLHGHDPRKKLEWALEWNLPEPLKIMNPKFLFRTFRRGVTEQKNRSASSRFLGKLSWFLRCQQVAKARRPTHGTYRFLPHPATELRSGFHGPDLPDIRGDRHGLDHLSASPLRDRSHLLQWPCRRRTLVAVPSLLQPRRLGHRHLLHAPGQVGRHDSRPGRHLLLGRRRHPLSQTRADPLRRRHALRPPHLQSRQIPGQLGTRLGRADPDRRLPPLGTVQSLRLAHRHAPVPQPPRADQGEKESEGEKGAAETRQTQARSESSHST